MGTQGPTAATVAFGSLTIAYDEQVLAPRGWTRAMSEWAAELAATRDTPGSKAILDLCCGVGPIGLLAARLSGWPLVQVDADPAACRWASANAAAAGMAEQVEIRCRHLSTEPAILAAADGEVVALDERFGIVLADPPYIPSAVAEVAGGAVRAAIDGGRDGLALVAACLRVAGRSVASGGAVLTSARGLTQAAAIEALTESDDGYRLSVSDVRAFGPERAIVRLVPW